MPTFRHSLLVLISALGALTFVAGCKSKTSKTDTGSEEKQQKTPLEFESERAPYSVTLPAGWRRTSADSINAHADLAATRQRRHFLIVIPQELPSVSGVDPPDVEALKTASLERMTANVEDLSVEREGPVELDGQPAISVFAEGIADDKPVQYITTFATHQGWGYQIIVWGPRQEESKLVDFVDAVVEGWQFTDVSVHSAESDAESDTGDTSP